MNNKQKQIYYSLAFDEMYIRQQVIYEAKTGTMIGRIDYGGLSKEPQHVLAKSALFCLATEINGTKSFPLMYILTAGIKCDALAEVIKKCILAVEKQNGRVYTISFDGLPANFAAVQKLGACLDVTAGIQPTIQFTTDEVPARSNHCHVVPDACHMLKLVRNNWKRKGIFFNGDGKVCSCSLLNYIRHILCILNTVKC